MLTRPFALPDRGHAFNITQGRRCSFSPKGFAWRSVPLRDWRVLLLAVLVQRECVEGCSRGGGRGNRMVWGVDGGHGVGRLEVKWRRVRFPQ